MTVTPAVIPDDQLEGVEYIELGKKKTKWPILELAPFQMEKIWEPMLALTDYFEGKMAAGEFGKTALQMTADQYRSMMDMVFWGLKGAHPDLKKEEFEHEIKFDPFQCMRAFFIIRRQSGLFAVVPADSPEAKKDEATDNGKPLAGPTGAE